MKYLNIIQSLSEIEVNTRFSIDIVSVAERVRDFGLLHIEAYKKDKTIKLLIENNCKIIASRDLKFLKDSESREGMLYDLKEHETPSHCEIWYSYLTKEIEPDFNPFSNSGKFLGYPICCYTKYESTTGMGEFYKEYLFPKIKTSRYNEINRLCTLFNPNLLMPDFFPCSLSCQQAYEFSVKIQSIVNLIYSNEETENTFKFKLAPLVIISEKLFCFPNYTFEFDKLTLKLDSASQFVNLSSILDQKYWPSMNKNNLLINFNNIKNTKKLYIEYNDKIEELKFDFI